MSSLGLQMAKGEQEDDQDSGVIDRRVREAGCGLKSAVRWMSGSGVEASSCRCLSSLCCDVVLLLPRCCGDEVALRAGGV